MTKKKHLTLSEKEHKLSHKFSILPFSLWSGASYTKTYIYIHLRRTCTEHFVVCTLYKTYITALLCYILLKMNGSILRLCAEFFARLQRIFLQQQYRSVSDWRNHIDVFYCVRDAQLTLRYLHKYIAKQTKETLKNKIVKENIIINKLFWYIGSKELSILTIRWFIVVVVMGGVGWRNGNFVLNNTTNNNNNEGGTSICCLIVYSYINTYTYIPTCIRIY